MTDQEEITAVVTPIPGDEKMKRVVTSTLVGLGFRVWHGVLGMMVSGTRDVWERTFDMSDGPGPELEVPDELKSHVQRVVLDRSSR